MRSGDPIPTPVFPRFLNVQGVSELLGLSPRAIYMRVARGYFPQGVIIYLGPKTMRFDAKKLEAFLATQGAQGARPTGATR